MKMESVLRQKGIESSTDVLPIGEDILIEICNHCGKDVSMGSGRFINRVPDLNDICTRISNNLVCPVGDYVCDECDKNSTTGNE